MVILSNTVLHNNMLTAVHLMSKGVITNKGFETYVAFNTTYLLY